MRAILALLKASLISTLKQPAAIVFSIIFPLIFIVVFGLLGGGGTSVGVYLAENSVKEGPLYEALDGIESVRFEEYKSDKEADSELKIGRLDSIVEISQKEEGGYEVDLRTSEAAPEAGGVIFSILDSISNRINLQTVELENPAITLEHEVVSGREYKQIDFILPGQLGFALLSSGIFGTAFLLLSLKETLVLKRFFATPIRKGSILLAEGLSKLVFSMLQAIIIIGAGFFFFDFTLINGFVTFFEMLLLTSLGLMTFLGLGFLVSTLADDQNSIPIVANLFTLPQFLLAGTFFPVELFPDWLQPISRVLPLTYLNDALRLVAFEGKGITEVLPQIAAMLIWIVIVYSITAKTFKWER
jgi:ABC-2 type transport system permease protein